MGLFEHRREILRAIRSNTYTNSYCDLCTYRDGYTYSDSYTESYSYSEASPDSSASPVVGCRKSQPAVTRHQCGGNIGCWVLRIESLASSHAFSHLQKH